MEKAILFPIPTLNSRFTATYKEGTKTNKGQTVSTCHSRVDTFYLSLFQKKETK